MAPLKRTEVHMAPLEPTGIYMAPLRFTGHYWIPVGALESTEHICRSVDTIRRQLERLETPGQHWEPLDSETLLRITGQGGGQLSRDQRRTSSQSS